MVKPSQIATKIFSTEVGPSRSLQTAAPVSQSFVRRGASLLAVTALLAVGAYLVREPALRAAADLWIVSDAVTRADAIVVLGGNYYVRPAIAAQLFHEGVADKILISQTARARNVSTASDTELNHTALVKLGVPPDAIETFGTANTNTRDEAVALREWARRNAASAFIVPAEKFTARRVRWIFRRELSGGGASITVPSFEQMGYTAREWWKSDQGVMAFKSELQKYMYYRWKY
jgi:uncharacterized SAM-binding protein YcdF (DUF218 family)